MLLGLVPRQKLMPFVVGFGGPGLGCGASLWDIGAARDLLRALTSGVKAHGQKI